MSKFFNNKKEKNVYPFHPVKLAITNEYKPCYIFQDIDTYKLHLGSPRAPHTHLSHQK